MEKEKPDWVSDVQKDTARYLVPRPNVRNDPNQLIII